jgi:hypothetical protein
MRLLEWFVREIVGEIGRILGTYHMVHAYQRLVQSCSQCLGGADTDTKATRHTCTSWVGTHTVLQELKIYLAHA